MSTAKAECHRVNEPVGGATAVLRRERRWVRSHLAENSTPLWSHHLILRSDETWLPEWSGNLGGVQRWRSSVAWGVLEQSWLKQFPLYQRGAVARRQLIVAG